MATFQTQKFIEAQKDRGRPDEEIFTFLRGKGIDPGRTAQDIPKPGVKFRERLAFSFGNRELGQDIEKELGLKGRLDVGDIADVAGVIPSLAGFLAGGAFGGSLGGPGGAIAGASAGSAIGETIRQSIGRLIGTQEGFEPKKIAVEAAFGAVPGFAGKALAPVGRGIKKVGGGLARTLFGVQGETALKTRFNDPEGVARFLQTARRQPGGGQLSDIEDLVRGGVKSISEASKQAFVKAEEGLVQKKLAGKEIARDAQNVIKEVLDIPKITKKSIFESGASDADARIINRVSTMISENKNFTTKGVLALKRRISNLFKANQQESKVVVSKLTGSEGVFNKVLGEADPAFKEALTSFSKEKTFLKKLGVNITGESKFNVDQTANKLTQLATDLDNPFKREGAERLLRELESRTGLPIVKTLRALSSAKTLSPQEAKGVISGLVRELARLLQVGISEVLGVAGKIGKAPDPVKKAVKGVTKVGTFESLPRE